MPLVVSIAAAQIEFTAAAAPLENFEASADSDFELLLERAERAKREMGQEAGRVE